MLLKDNDKYSSYFISFVHARFMAIMTIQLAIQNVACEASVSFWFSAQSFEQEHKIRTLLLRHPRRPRGR